jgi:curved DNA-binding protein CbpA
MSHYETLGVPEDASPEQIKRAYRAKAREKHPDKGGTQSDFEPVVKAYETLKDPQRRALYDGAGIDVELKPIEEEAERILLQGFSVALAQEQNVQIVAFVRGNIAKQLREFPASIKSLGAKKKKLTSQRKKVKCTGAKNIAHMIIDAEIKNIEGQLVNLHHQTKVGETALKMLDSYSDEWDVDAMLTTGVRGTFYPNLGIWESSI